MNIDKPLLHKMAHLARLEVEERHEAGLLEDLNKIVRWIDKLQEVDTTDVRPLAIMSAEQNVFQKDTPQISLASLFSVIIHYFWSMVNFYSIRALRACT